MLRAQARTPASQAVIELAVRVDGARVLDARFLAFGCPTTIAVGAFLAEHLRGASRARAAALDARAIRAALEIPDERAHCALVGEDVLKEVLARWDARKSDH